MRFVNWHLCGGAGSDRLLICSARHNGFLWKNPYIRFMKLELPFALILLAGGCYLWTWQSGKAVRPTNTTQPAKPTTTTKSPTTFAAASTLKSHENTSPTPAMARVKHDLDASKLLSAAAKNLTNSPPIQSLARLEVEMFQQHVRTEGRYLQQGQGSGKTRLEFRYPTGQSSSAQEIGKLTQICDGQYYYRINEFAGKRELASANLEEVARLGLQPLGIQPTTWMQTGGLASLMEHLAVSFDFDPPVETEISNIPAVLLRGTWKLGVLKHVLAEQVEQKWLEAPVRWDRLPPQLPHMVEIYLAADDFLPLFPYQISFQQFNPSNKNRNDAPQARSLAITENRRPIVTIKFQEVSKVPGISDDLFRVDSLTNDDSQDLTPGLVQHFEATAESLRTAGLEQTTTTSR